MPQKLSPARPILAVTGAVLVIGAGVLGALVLAGVVRFGHPSVSSAVTASSVEGSRPSRLARTFSENAPRIYLCATLRAFSDSVLEARWYSGSALECVTSRKFSEFAGPAPGSFAPSTADAVFYLERPRGGWPPGSHSVTITVDGKQLAKNDFTIGRPGPGLDVYVPYEDPGGAFSLGVPAGWSKAEQSSTGGAVVGFVAPSDPGYPPRFAVSLTDFTSADPAYLDSQLSTSEQSEKFRPYSLGESRGARREYSWEHNEGGKSVKLKSIQVVLQGKGKVYSLDCHCASEDYASLSGVLDHIVNSFRVKGAV